jgi:hypothetical protein
MLVQRLREFAEERMDLAPPMYQEQPIRYLVALGPDGRYLGIRDTASKGDKTQKNGQRRLAPHVKRTVGSGPSCSPTPRHMFSGLAAKAASRSASPSSMSSSSD